MAAVPVTALGPSDPLGGAGIRARTQREGAACLFAAPRYIQEDISNFVARSGA